MNRWICLTLCALIFFSGCVRYDAALPTQPEPVSVAVEEYRPDTSAPEPEEYLPTVRFRYGRSFMEGEAAALYDRIWEFLSSPVDDNAIPIGNVLSDEEVLHIIEVFKRENPIYYWADISPLGRYVIVTSELSPEEIARQREAIEARAAAILDPISYDASPFEIALAIHDALAVIPYCHDATQPHRDNLYGTLVRRGAVCGGYASAFLYLTELAGLESVFLVGASRRGISHAWNAVKLDGSWHFVDVTWNRPLGRFDSVFHSYFLIDTQTLLAERYWDENQFPVMPEPGEGFKDFYQRMGYSVSGSPPYNAVDILADIFYRQILARPSIPTSAQPVFLEMRVSDSPEIYAEWRGIFVRNLFDILRAVHARAVYEDAGFVVANLNNVSIDYNDIAQVLVFYPIIRKA